MTTAGYLSKNFADRTGRLYPDDKKDTDSITNSMSHGLSLLENIPHGHSNRGYFKDKLLSSLESCTGQVDDSPFDAEALISRMKGKQKIIHSFLDILILTKLSIIHLWMTLEMYLYLEISIQI